MNINTFIFDLGGVIINLQEPASFDQLQSLSRVSKPETQQFFSESPVFKDYEQGFISSDEFREGLRAGLSMAATDKDIDDAWNAMLGDIPMERLELLQKLRENHKVMILSNTNAIHELCFNQILQNISGESHLSAFVDHVFFSHEMGMRKPNLDIYQEVLKRSETNAATSLFLDDKLENLEGAAQTGIQTMHITHPDHIVNVLKYA